MFTNTGAAMVCHDCGKQANPTISQIRLIEGKAVCVPVCTDCLQNSMTPTEKVNTYQQRGIYKRG